MVLFLLGQFRQLFRGVTHAADHALDHGAYLFRRALQRTEAGHGVGISKIPCIFGKPDKVADRGIGGPCAAKRRTAGVCNRQARVCLDGLVEDLDGPGGLAQLGQAPESSLNHPIGPHRRLEPVRLSLEEVKRIRKALGLTQRQFAERLGVHVVTVAKWETDAQGIRGPAVPPADVYLRGADGRWNFLHSARVQSDGVTVAARVESADEAARVARGHWQLGRHSALVLARPPDESIDDVEPLIEQALAEAENRGLTGPAVTVG